MKGLENSPLRFQLHPVRRAASKCSNGVSPVDLADAHSSGLAICPVPHARCRSLTCDTSHPAEELHEPPMREVYPIAGVDPARLREIRFQGNLKLDEASDCREALALSRDESVPVLPCERDHADGNWQNLLNIMRSLPPLPNVIVFSRLADESFWAKVLNRRFRRADDAVRVRTCVVKSSSLPGAAGSAAMLRVSARSTEAVGRIMSEVSD